MTAGWLDRLKTLRLLIGTVLCLGAIGAIDLRLAGFGLSRQGPSPPRRDQMLVVTSPPGHRGGRLVVAQRAEPRTFNPVLAVDAPSREIIRPLMGDLIAINRATHRTEAALAASWKLSPDERRYTIQLRQGVRFSDGHPFDADDVVFTFRVYQDDKINSTQRGLLQVGGKPIVVRKVDAYQVVVELAAPSAAAERLFDSVAMLPAHQLESAYNEGKFLETWSIASRGEQIAGLGPFRLKERVPGVRTTLERNPYYWKRDRTGQQLPYLDELVFTVVSSEDAQVLRFESGETDVLSRISGENFNLLATRNKSAHYEILDVGPSLEYNFVFFNLNALDTARTELLAKQRWFQRRGFRAAIASAIDRESIVRLVYQGRGTALWGHVTPGNKLWVDASVPRPQRSLDRARALLRTEGFGWTPSGTLVDDRGTPVRFSILTSASNPQRIKMATLIQDDLKALGIQVSVAAIEFRAMIDRVLQSKDYEAAIMALGSGDVDPTTEMNVWMSSGATHLWNPSQRSPATPWEAEIDRLMQRQLVTTIYSKRRPVYDRVQQIVAEQLPIIPLASPNVLVASRRGLGNFRPGIIEPSALWNSDELFWRPGSQQ